MSYATQAIMAHDVNLIQRVSACAATQGIPNPEQWVWERAWKFSSVPGWDKAYSAAILSNNSNSNSNSSVPGNNESVITDLMILSAVKVEMAESVVPVQPSMA